MLYITNALSQITDIFVSTKDWDTSTPDTVKGFFTKYNGVGVLPLTKQNTGASQNQAPQTEQKPTYEKEEPEVIVESEPNCGLLEYFNSLCDHEFRIYALYREVKERWVKIRIQACPDYDIGWDKKRPFDEMNEVAGTIYSMAGYRLDVKHFTYKKPGRTPDEKRSIFVKADQLNWLVGKDGKPLLVGKPPRPKKARNQLVITDDGEFKVA
ncbi:MAG: hypothetical protein AAB340_01935 [Patescibacteria group bacterium]